MKKILLMFGMLLVSVSMSAQLMRAEELEKYAKEKYGDKWTEAAENISKQVTLDKNNALTFTQIIEAPARPKSSCM